MVENFVAEFSRLVVAKPERIRVTKHTTNDPTLMEIVIYADGADVGKLIGKDGKMIASIKTLISGCKAKDGFAYRVVLRADGE